MRMYGSFLRKAIPSVPGLEFTVPENRLHFAVPVNRMHYTLPDNRLHFAVPEED